MLAISKNKRLIVLLIAVALILCVPLIAMFFTSEVNWDVLDFVVAGSLLVGTVLAIEFVLRRITYKHQ